LRAPAAELGHNGQSGQRFRQSRSAGLGVQVFGEDGHFEEEGAGFVFVFVDDADELALEFDLGGVLLLARDDRHVRVAERTLQVRLDGERLAARVSLNRRLCRCVGSADLQLLTSPPPSAAWFRPAKTQWLQRERWNGLN
jgi:hypothetical protein